MTIKQIARSILTLCLIAFAIWLGRSWKFYIEALASIFFACSLASVIIIHFRIVPLWRDAVLVVCGTFILSAIDFQVLHYRPMLPAWLSFAGLSSLVTLGVRAIWANRADRKLLGFSFFPALLLVLSAYFATTLPVSILVRCQSRFATPISSGTEICWVAFARTCESALLYCFGNSHCRDLRGPLSSFAGKGFAFFRGLPGYGAAWRAVL